MKILQMVPYFYPAWAYGGPAKLVYDTSKYFAESGHEVTVYTSDSYDEKKRMPKEKYVTDVKGLNVRYFRNINNNLAYVYNIFFTPGIFIQSLKEFNKFDVIHLHDFYTPQNVWISFLSEIYKKPYILSVHGCLEKQRLEQRSLFKQIFLKLFGKMLLNNASFLVATSLNEIVAYQEYGIPKEKIVFFGHGVNPEEFQTEVSKLVARKNFGLNRNDCVVTFLGRIHRIKGLDNLVKAIRRIKNPKIHFVIAGSNDGYLPQLKKDIQKYKLQKKITLWGTCFGEEKSQLFKASDIFVYPSYSEGFSLGILEAAASGLPLVITSGCHFDEVGKQKAGIVVDPDDEQIANAIEKIAEDYKLRIQFGKNAERLIFNDFSMKVIGDRIITIYQKAVKMSR
ncbi:MAG: glycosyltransferase [Microgenomates group bacterium]|jgi:glycosyltransferase involved in cell wall biosynthesis